MELEHILHLQITASVLRYGKTQKQSCEVNVS